MATSEVVLHEEYVREKNKYPKNHIYFLGRTTPLDRHKGNTAFLLPSNLHRSKIFNLVIMATTFINLIQRSSGMDIFGVNLFGQHTDLDYKLSSGFAQGVYFPGPINKFIFSDGKDTSKVYTFEGKYDTNFTSLTSETYLRSIVAEDGKLLQLRNLKISKYAFQIVGSTSVLVDSAPVIGTSSDYSSWASDLSQSATTTVFFSPFVTSPKVFRLDLALNTLTPSSTSLSNKAMFLFDIGANRLAIGGLFNDLQIWDPTTLSSLSTITVGNSLEIATFERASNLLYAVQPKTGPTSRSLLKYSTVSGVALLSNTILSCTTSAITSLFVASAPTATPDIIFYTCAGSTTLNSYQYPATPNAAVSLSHYILSGGIKSSSDMYRVVRGPTLRGTEVYFMYPWQISTSSNDIFLGLNFVSIAGQTCVSTYGGGGKCRTCASGRYLYSQGPATSCIYPEQILAPTFGADKADSSVVNCLDSNCFDCQLDNTICTICQPGNFYDPNGMCNPPPVLTNYSHFDTNTKRFELQFNASFVDLTKLSVLSFTLKDILGQLEPCAVQDLAIDPTNNTVSGTLIRMYPQYPAQLAIGNCPYLFNGIPVNNAFIDINPSQLSQAIVAKSQNTEVNDKWSSTSTSNAALGVTVGTSLAIGSMAAVSASVTATGGAAVGSAAATSAVGASSSGLASFVKLFSNIDYLLLVDSIRIKKAEKFLVYFRGQILDIIPNPFQTPESAVRCFAASSFQREGISCSVLNNYGSEYTAIAGIATISIALIYFWRFLKRERKSSDSVSLEKSSSYRRTISFTEAAVSGVFSLEALAALLEGSSIEGVRWSMVTLTFPSISEHMQIARIIAILTILFYSFLGVLMYTYLSSARSLAIDGKPKSEAKLKIFSFLLQDYKFGVTSWIAIYSPLLLYIKNSSTQFILVVAADHGIKQIWILISLELAGLVITIIQLRFQKGAVRFSKLGQQFCISSILFTYLIINVTAIPEEARENVYSYILCAQFLAIIAFALSIQLWELFVVTKESLAQCKRKRVVTHPDQKKVEETNLDLMSAFPCSNMIMPVSRGDSNNAKNFGDNTISIRPEKLKLIQISPETKGSKFGMANSGHENLFGSKRQESMTKIQLSEQSSCPMSLITRQVKRDGITSKRHMRSSSRSRARQSSIAAMNPYSPDKNFMHSEVISGEVCLNQGTSHTQRPINTCNSYSPDISIRRGTQRTPSVQSINNVSTTPVV
jgi:hypothetical protein